MTTALMYPTGPEHRRRWMTNGNVTARVVAHGPLTDHEDSVWFDKYRRCTIRKAYRTMRESGMPAMLARWLTWELFTLGMSSANTGWATTEKVIGGLP